MNPTPAVAIAVTFVWLGMVLAIAFLETPLKFRAPEVTVRIGLGIGRVVFRALNAAEVALAVVLVVAGVLGGATGGVVALGAVPVVVAKVLALLVTGALLLAA